MLLDFTFERLLFTRRALADTPREWATSKRHPMIKNRASPNCNPTLEEMLFVPNVSVLWHHSLPLALNYDQSGKICIHFWSQGLLFTASARPRVESAAFFFSDRGAVCKYYDGWLSGYAIGVLAQCGVWVMLGVCDEVRLIMVVYIPAVLATF